MKTKSAPKLETMPRYRLCQTAFLMLLLLTAANNVFGFAVGNRVMAASGGANVRDTALANVLFQQYGGVHGTITAGPVVATAGGYTGNWWKINWDSEPPNQSGYQGYSAESVIALAPSAGDVSQPNFSSSYYTTANHFWTQGDAPGTSVPGNLWPAGAYGNCTWYAYGRMLQLGYSSSQLAAIAPPGLGSAYQWGANAVGSTAVSLGVTVNSTPTAGSIAWLNSGSFSSLGHVAVVESVNLDGTITVSESSYSTSSTSVWNFLWHHRTVSPTWFTSFIHCSTGGSAPSAPSANAATSITSSSFQANWSSSSGATGYRIDVSTSSTFSTFAGGIQDYDLGNYLGITITSLNAGTTYYYRVRAYNGNGTSGNSGAIVVTTVPPSPVATAATSVTSSGFTANWNSSSGATGYRIDVSTSSTFNTYINGGQDADMGNSLVAYVSGLSASTPYYYRVRAYNGSGTSGNSGTITASTLAIPVSTINSVTPAPSSGANATVGQSFALAVNVNYSFVTAGYLQVWVYDNGFVTSVMNGVANTSPQAAAVQINLNLPSNAAGQHNYTIYAQFRPGATGGPLLSDGINDVIQSSSYSLNWQNATPSAPTAAPATSVTSSAFTANWGSVSGATGYRIDVSTSSTFNTYINGGQDADMGNQLFAFASGLSANTPYYYRVRAYNASGTSGNSGTITATTLPNPPAAPTANTASSVTSSGFTANWSSANGATGYRLDISTSSTFSSYVGGYQNLDMLNFLSRTVSGLSAGTTYYYRVRAYNTGGTSGNSGTIMVATTGGGGASSPPITSPQLAGTTFTLSVPTQVGFSYTLEYKHSFSDATWTAVQTVSGTGGTIILTDTGATDSSRLYHVRVQ